MDQARLIADNISKSFGKKEIIHHFSCSLNEGIHVFTGDNGCGKTSLLKMMMGLTLPDSGEIFLFGENTKIFSKHTKEKINFVSASDRTLYYKLTATENLKYIGHIYGIKKKDCDCIIPQLLDMVGIQEEGKYVETFSTGMKKRLMIAKSLINDPEILFYDEVFSGLDADGCQMALNILERLKKQGKLIILVTHQADLIPENSTIYQLKDGKIYVLDR